MKIRKAVLWFSEKMEEQLKDNDHKGGWTGAGENFLLDELRRNLSQLMLTIHRRNVNISGFDQMEAIRRCANIANFAMMLADNYDKEIGDVEN